MQHIFLVIGSCSENVILNTAPTPELKTHFLWECWAPDGTLYLLEAKNIAGSIIEFDSIIRNGQFVQNVPTGSFVVTDTEESGWYVNRYYLGKYNNMIIKVMEAFGVTEYQLPFYKKH